ncbi:helix-turn-helix transcriptional regulator [Pseudomonas sp. 910_21]|uniref:helix-turn-helix transcriptional regulator n=1 Tax=Pseudomonas sp. 910_21 TaxID=2604460 RepID=UPI004064329B
MQTQEQHIEHIEYIKLPEVKNLTGMGTTFIYMKAKAGEFPRQVKLGSRSVAWIKSEVLQWNLAQAQASRAQQA